MAFHAKTQAKIFLLNRAPVAQHLEEGVVVDVLADVVEVVVLPAGAHALLRVDGAPVVVGQIDVIFGVQ